MDSKDRVAVVTGGGSGIGRATALAFMEDGWRVAVAGRRKEPLEETLKLGGVGADRGLAMATDVGDPQAVAALFNAVKSKFGRVDMLFNNAGGNAPGILFEDLTWEKWKSVVDANLNGSFLCAQAAYRIMKDQDPKGGRIINNGSISAHAPRPDSAPYTATKHAISGLTRTISLDGRKYDIACCQIDVGNAMSELASRMSRGVKQADGSVKTEPMIDVKDVARSVLFMANQPLDVNIYHLTVMATKMPVRGTGVSVTADWLEAAAFGASYPQVVAATIAWFLLIYTLIAGGAYAIAVGRLPDTVQSGEGRTQRMRPGQVCDELTLSLVSILIFAAQAAGLVWALREGWLIASWERPLWHLLWELPVLYLWNELHFFAVHRLLHWPPLYRTVHVRHHRSVITTPFSAYCFHPVESFLLGSVMPLALVLHPFSPLALVGLTIMSLMLNVAGHLPHERLRPAFAFAAPHTRYHNEHHRRFHTHFSFSLAPLDWLFSTRRPDEGNRP